MSRTISRLPCAEALEDRRLLSGVVPFVTRLLADLAVLAPAGHFHAAAAPDQGTTAGTDTGQNAAADNGTTTGVASENTRQPSSGTDGETGATSLRVNDVAQLTAAPVQSASLGRGGGNNGGDGCGRSQKSQAAPADPAPAAEPAAPKDQPPPVTEAPQQEFTFAGGVSSGPHSSDVPRADGTLGGHAPGGAVNPAAPPAGGAGHDAAEDGAPQPDLAGWAGTAAEVRPLPAGPAQAPAPGSAVGQLLELLPAPVAALGSGVQDLAGRIEGLGQELTAGGGHALYAWLVAGALAAALAEAGRRYRRRSKRGVALVAGGALAYYTELQ